MSRGLVHRGVVTLVAPGERVRDAEGRWKSMGDPVPVPEALVRHLGRGETEMEIGNRKTSATDVVVLVPLGTDVEQGRKVEVRTLGQNLDGDYRVAAVKDVVKHLRLICLREDV